MLTLRRRGKPKPPRQWGAADARRGFLVAYLGEFQTADTGASPSYLCRRVSVLVRNDSPKGSGVIEWRMEETRGGGRRGHGVDGVQCLGRRRLDVAVADARTWASVPLGHDLTVIEPREFLAWDEHDLRWDHDFVLYTLAGTPEEIRQQVSLWDVDADDRRVHTTP